MDRTKFNEAMAIGARDVLANVTADRWVNFLHECLPIDDALLGDLQDQVIARRWCQLIGDMATVRGLELDDNLTARLLGRASS